MGEPSSLGNSGWGRSVGGFCGGVGGCGSWGVGGHSTGGWLKVGLSSGDWLTVGPSMGSWSRILSFRSLCHSSVIMLILVLIGSFLNYRFVCWFRCSVILLLMIQKARDR